MFAALGSLGIMNYIKIGLVVVIALAIGGLYWYGQHESALVDAGNVKLGAQAQLIADDHANIAALQSANQNWAKAFEKYKQDAQNQADALKLALVTKEKINAELNAIEAKLRTNPSGAAADLNSLNRRIVCLLDDASGGRGDGCPVAAAVAPGSPASSAP